MKCVGVVGFSGAGQKRLMTELSQELRRRTYQVAVVECVAGLNDDTVTKTDITDNWSRAVVTCFPDKSVFSFGQSMSLDDVLAHLDVDYALINGFQEDKSYPRIVMMDDPSKEKESFDGLEIACYGKAQPSRLPMTQNITQLVDIIEEKSFKLPNLNCEACGFESCYAFAKEMIKGNRPLDDCVSLNPKVTIEIDGTSLPMNPFISGIVEKTIRALVSSFKGYKKGPIKVTIG